MLFRNWYYLYANPTPSELAIEPAIASLGKRYRSQHLFPKLRHVADFVLLDDKIIIEVDGSSHLKPEQIRKDLKHTIELEKMGYRVVRCTNEEAQSHPFVIVSELLGERLTRRPSLAELEAALQALGPEPTRVRARRQKRKPKSPPKSGRAKKASGVKGPPTAK